MIIWYDKYDYYDKQNVTYLHYSDRNEWNSDINVGTCMNFKHIMLSKLNEVERDKYWMTPLTWDTKLIKIIELASTMTVTNEGEDDTLLFSRYSVWFRMIKILGKPQWPIVVQPLNYMF